MIGSIEITFSTRTVKDANILFKDVMKVVADCNPETINILEIVPIVSNDLDRKDNLLIFRSAENNWAFQMVNPLGKNPIKGE